MSTASIPEIEQELVQLVVQIGQNLTDTYVSMSAISFLLYDIFINLDREVEHIWKARWSVAKVLFIIGRYYGICYLSITFAVSITVGLSLEFCRAWWWYLIMAGDIFYISLVNVILIMRLYAIYRNLKVLAFFVTLFICEFSFELYASLAIAIESSRTAFTVPAGIPFPGCLATSNVKTPLFAWVPSMVIATAFFAMTIAKVAPDGKIGLKRLIDIKHIPPLLVSMVRDGALYYFLIIVFQLVGILFIEREQGLIASAPLPYLIVVYSLTASRLVLNLREAGSRTHYGVSTLEAGTITEPVFVMGPASRAGRDTEVSCES